MGAGRRKIQNGYGEQGKQAKMRGGRELGEGWREKASMEGDGCREWKVAKGVRRRKQSR